MKLKLLASLCVLTTLAKLGACQAEENDEDTIAPPVVRYFRLDEGDGEGEGSEVSSIVAADEDDEDQVQTSKFIEDDLQVPDDNVVAEEFVDDNDGALSKVDEFHGDQDSDSGEESDSEDDEETVGEDGADEDGESVEDGDDGDEDSDDEDDDDNEFLGDSENVHQQQDVIDDQQEVVGFEDLAKGSERVELGEGETDEFMSIGEEALQSFGGDEKMAPNEQTRNRVSLLIVGLVVAGTVVFVFVACVGCSPTTTHTVITKLHYHSTKTTRMQAAPRATDCTNDSLSETDPLLHQKTPSAPPSYEASQQSQQPQGMPCAPPYDVSQQQQQQQQQQQMMPSEVANFGVFSQNPMPPPISGGGFLPPSFLHAAQYQGQPQAAQAQGTAVPQSSVMVVGHYQMAPPPQQGQGQQATSVAVAAAPSPSFGGYPAGYGATTTTATMNMV